MNETISFIPKQNKDVPTEFQKSYNQFPQRTLQRTHQFINVLTDEFIPIDIYNKMLMGIDTQSEQMEQQKMLNELELKRKGIFIDKMTGKLDLGTIEQKRKADEEFETLKKTQSTAMVEKLHNIDTNTRRFYLAMTSPDSEIMERLREMGLTGAESKSLILEELVQTIEKRKSKEEEKRKQYEEEFNYLREEIEIREKELKRKTEILLKNLKPYLDTPVAEIKKESYKIVVGEVLNYIGLKPKDYLYINENDKIKEPHKMGQIIIDILFKKYTERDGKENIEKRIQKLQEETIINWTRRYNDIIDKIIKTFSSKLKDPQLT